MRSLTASSLNCRPSMMECVGAAGAACGVGVLSQVMKPDNRKDSRGGTCRGSQDGGCLSMCFCICVYMCVCVYEVLAGCVHRQSRGCAKHERRAIRVQNTTRSPCRLDFPIRRSDWTNKSCPSLSAWQCASLATVAGSPASRIKIGNWRLVTGDWQPAGNRRLVWPGFRVSR